MRRAITIMLVCAVVHIGPPIIYLTLAVGAPDVAHDLFAYGLAWAVALLGYDVLRMRRYD